jgi:hypothetical protein
MMQRREPTRGRLILLTVVGAVVLLVELVVVAAYARSGVLFQGGRWILPALLIAYALYVLWTSTRKLTRGE